MRAILCLAAMSLMMPRLVLAQDAECVIQICTEDSPHAGEHISCETPACYCWDNCGGGGGSSAGASGNDDNAGVPPIIAAVVALVFLVAAPVFTIEFKRDSAKIRAEERRAVAAWQAYRDEIRLVEEVGRQARRDRKRARAARAARKRAVKPPPSAAAPPKPPADYPWVLPRLELTKEQRCDRVRFGSIFYLGGALADFANEDEMLRECGPFTKPHCVYRPSANDDKCTKPAEPTFDCHVDGAWCPQSAPWYNPCEPGCYPSMDFRGAEFPAGRHCSSGFDCNASWAPR